MNLSDLLADVQVSAERPAAADLQSAMLELLDAAGLAPEEYGAGLNGSLLVKIICPRASEHSEGARAQAERDTTVELYVDGGHSLKCKHLSGGHDTFTSLRDAVETMDPADETRAVLTAGLAEVDYCRRFDLAQSAFEDVVKETAASPDRRRLAMDAIRGQLRLLAGPDAPDVVDELVRYLHQKLTGTPEVLRVAPITPVRLTDLQPWPWLIRDLLMRGEVTMLYAPGGTYKSSLTLAIATALAAAVDFGSMARGKGEEGKRLRTLLVSPEDGTAVIKRRYAAIAKLWRRDGPADGILEAPGMPDVLARDAKPVGGWTLLARSAAFGSRPLPTAFCDSLRETVVRGQYDLVILDPMARFAGGLNENDSGDMTALIDVVAEIAEKANAAIVMTHHTGKDDGKAKRANLSRARGSSAIPAGSRISVELEQLEQHKRYRAVVTKTNYGRPGASWEYGVRVVAVGKPEDDIEVPAVEGLDTGGEFDDDCWGGLTEAQGQAIDRVILTGHFSAKATKSPNRRSEDVRACAMIAGRCGVSEEQAQKFVDERLLRGHWIQEEVRDAKGKPRLILRCAPGYVEAQDLLLRPEDDVCA